MSQVEISRKVTVAALGLPKAQIQAMVAGWEEGQEGDVATIYGAASKVIVQPSKLDPTKTDTKFVGTFEGINLLTGETVVASNAYFPGAVSEMLEHAVENATGPVEFSCMIAVKKNSKSAVGYTFSVRMDRDPEVADPLEALRSKARALASASDVPALPAPKRGRPAKTAE